MSYATLPRMPRQLRRNSLGPSWLLVANIGARTTLFWLCQTPSPENFVSDRVVIRGGAELRNGRNARRDLFALLA